MRFCLQLILCLAILPMGVFAGTAGKVKVCQQKPILEKSLRDKAVSERPTSERPALERIKLDKAPSAIEGIRASIERPQFDKPQFDKSKYEDNCGPQKEISNDVQRILDQQNLPPSVVRMIKDAIKGRQTPKPGDCPCTATTVNPEGRVSN